MRDLAINPRKMRKKGKAVKIDLTRSMKIKNLCTTLGSDTASR